MKKFLLFLFVLLGTETIFAQTNGFTITTAEGVPMFFEIRDAVNKKVTMTRDPTASWPTPPYPHYSRVVVPSKVTYKGDEYSVIEMRWAALAYMKIDSLSLPADIKLVGQCFVNVSLKHLYMPSNLEVWSNNCLWSSVGTGDAGVKEVWVNSKLKRIESFSTWCVGASINRFHGFTSSNIEEVALMAFSPLSTELINDLAVLPQTIRVLGNQCFGFSPLPLAKLTIPASMENIGSGVYNISNDVYISHTSPFTLGGTAFGSQATLKIHVPIDRSFAFQTASGWSNYTNNIVEELKIGPEGYTTYYLENENFLIPVGCTAYIITGVTPSGSITTPDQAVVKAFSAGKIIPKKTGFILQGTPNSTVVYQANVTGPEENVTGNLLIGTATEQEISGAGYKYYIFSANGDQGLGFYKQGTRQGASIKLKPHRAGLRLDESIGRAKSLIFDFDAARREAETTGIRSVRPEMQRRDNAVYDLQGRRVINPTHGIYIINGKKIIK